ncbi:Alpha/Beta hydrolase protein [Mycena epipterygia]|nr:Alpha/Beta hydrolase protein [Mycena epipterygia]
MVAPFTRLPAGATIRPEPFKVAIPQSDVDELATLLKLSKLAPATYENLHPDRKYGITTGWMEHAKKEWETFDWREHEAHMNAFPHYLSSITDTDGKAYTIHFIAIFSENTDAIPLMLLHGWPGSFLEFLGILGILSSRYTPATLPYHIVVPSLPGYAFSSPPPLDRDFQLQDISRLFNSLMVQLGFADGYIVQGGDVGSKVARVMAAEQAHCKAVHINFCYMPEPSGISQLTEADRAGILRTEEFKRTGSAYALEHATRPATLGFVLASNPLALLAWIGEKFMDWTDEDPKIETVLEAVSLYWFTDTIARSLYPYRQLFTPGQIGAHENPKWYITKAFGYSSFPKEITPIPRAWAETTGKLVFFRVHEKVCYSCVKSKLH